MGHTLPEACDLKLIWLYNLKHILQTNYFVCMPTYVTPKLKNTMYFNSRSDNDCGLIDKDQDHRLSMHVFVVIFNRCHIAIFCR